MKPPGSEGLAFSPYSFHRMHGIFEGYKWKKCMVTTGDIVNHYSDLLLVNPGD